jgi:glucose-1-phosphate thymidylyltransferase
MYLGDNLLKQEVTSPINNYIKNDSDCVSSVTRVRKSESLRIVEIDSKGNIAKLVEKQEPKSILALVGTYLFNNSIFERSKKIKPSWRNELEITDASNFLRKTKNKCRV